MITMLMLIFVVASCFGGSVVTLELPDCERGGCEKSPDPEGEEPCQPLEKSMECSIGVMSTCWGKYFKTLALSDEERRSETGNIFIRMSSLIDDFCDPTSRLHKDYMQNYKCIGEVFFRPWNLGLCAVGARAHYEGFRPDAEQDDQERECMIAAHVVACLSGELLRMCGETAQSVVVETYKRSRLMAVCTPQMLQDLQTTYSDYLEQESDGHNVFENFFNLRN